MNQHVNLMKSLLPPRTSDARTHREWKIIGREMYCRDVHGVFKLSIYSGGVHNGFHGLEGQFVSYASGVCDRIVFRFADLIEPDYATANAKRPRADMDESTLPSVHVYIDGVRPGEAWDWYIVPPKSLKTFHQAIRDWMAIWSST